MSLTAPEKVKQKLVHMVTGETLTDPAAIRERYSSFADDSDLDEGRAEAECELRSGGYATGLPCDYSRHYESKAVAARMLDGSWVGWTYWYGGGKHGEPDGIEWIGAAYDVTVTEVMEPVKKWAKKEG